MTNIFAWEYVRFQVELSFADIIDCKCNHVPGETPSLKEKKWKSGNIHVSSDAGRSQEKPFWRKPLERDGAGTSRGEGSLGVNFISQAQSAEFDCQVTLDQDVPGSHIPMK